MRFHQTLAFLLLLAAACNDEPATTDPVNGTGDGLVVVSSATEGVVVTAYELDLATGTRGAVIAMSSPTDEAGRFHLDLGSYHGGLALVAQRVGSTYFEPASGTRVAWDATTTLQAVFLEWTPAGALDFDFDRKQHVTDFVISPFTDLAVTYATVRQRLGLSPTFAQALDDAHRAVHAHLELDYWATVPADLTDATLAPGWNEAVQFGAELAGLSRMARKMSEDSSGSPGGISTLRLLAELKTDLSDARAKLDGQGPAGAIVLGTCATICPFSGATLRGTWAEAIAAFLGSSENASGVAVRDALPLLERISARNGALFLEGGTDLDTIPPSIVVAGVEDADILTADVAITVTATDAIEGGTLTARFLRGGVPTSGFYTETPTLVDAQTRRLALVVRTAELTDGPLALELDATDKAGNAAPTVRLSLFIDNSPLGTISGVVDLGGRLVGARVATYEFDGGVRGRDLGTATTDAEGRYFITVAESTQTTLLLQATNDPATSPARYIEPTNGTTITFSSADVLESALEGWTDGASRTDGVITPYTHAAMALARGRAAVGTSFAAALTSAFGDIQEHVSEGTNPIDIRNVQPVDVTEAGAVTTLNAQARYALVLVGFGGLADAHAAASGATASSMNTLSLTKLLAQDLGGEVSQATLWDGRTAAGVLRHGRVDLTSYVTRVDLAVAIVNFLESNPRNQTPFRETDVDGLLNQLAMDANPGLYPSADAPIPYDTIGPGPVAFTTPTPPDGQVLRGSVSLLAQAMDNRALKSFDWTAPLAALSSILLDRGAAGNVAGPWILSATLNTDVLPEGNVVVTARATDEALHTTDITRTFVVDRTSPAAAIAQARLDSAAGTPVANGGWFATATLYVTGTATDAHFDRATYSWNGGAAQPLTVAAGGSWSLTLTASGGANTLVVTALDTAGNSGTASATYNRDVTAPTITVSETTVGSEALLVATVVSTADSWGAVSYSGGTTTVFLNALTPATFSKYSSRYTSAGPNLPEWHFSVVDNHSADPSVKLWARLYRGTTILAGPIEVPRVAGGTYNRAQVISSVLHTDVALLSGRFKLELFADDEFGNRSGATWVQWDQVILTPPVRQRDGTAYMSCPFGPPSRCLRDARLETNNASGIQTAGFAIATGVLDNPNPVPIRVRIRVAAPATYSRQLLWTEVQTTDPTTLKSGCGSGMAPMLPDGTCYTSPTPLSHELTGQSAGDLYEGLDVRTLTGAATYTPLLPCSGCAADERILPPQTTNIVAVTSKAFAFLTPATLEEVAGTSYGTITASRHEKWLDCVRTNPLETVCMDQVEMQTLRMLARAKVSTAVNVSLDARPDSAAAPWAAATGPNTSGFGYYAPAWNTAETGFTAYP